MKKTLFIGLLAGICIGAAILVKQNPDNKAATSPSHSDEKLRTRKYPRQTSMNEFCVKIKNLIPRLRTYGQKWVLVGGNCSEIQQDHYVINVEVPVFFYTDDLQISIKPESKYYLVDVTSESRVGKSDLGENRRHILKLLKALDKEFGNF